MRCVDKELYDIWDMEFKKFFKISIWNFNSDIFWRYWLTGNASFDIRKFKQYLIKLGYDDKTYKNMEIFVKEKFGKKALDFIKYIIYITYRR